MKKLISVVTPCYNEAGNVIELYTRIKRAFEGLPHYDYEHICIDNCSEDGTGDILRRLAKTDKRLKVILNARNFGHIRSPFYAMLQARGDAVISIAGDLEDPPELIPQLIERWERGYKIVAAVRKQSQKNQFFDKVRRLYYRTLNRVSNVKHIENFYGNGLYDRTIIEIFRTIDDPYPYVRGIVAELGYDICELEFLQNRRKKGHSKNNLFTLYDMAMLGFASYSKIPLRLATFSGFVLSFVCILVAIAYFIYKLLFWEQFTLGLAPLIIGLFFLGSVQLLFLGILGEYVGWIFTKVQKRPLVIEKERINFESEPSRVTPK